MADQKKVDFFAQLDGLGEDQVRESIAAGVYNPTRTRLAEEWLRRKDQERENALTREQMDIARDAAASARIAADSARESVREAKRSNTIARTAIAIAIVSIIIAVIGL